MIRSLVLALSFVLVAPVLADEKTSPKADPKEPAKTVFQKLSHDKAIEKAKADKKVVMIDFYADWCGPCRQLEQKTFSEEKVQKFLNDKTVAIRVNVDDDPKLTAQYKVNAIPCIVFLDGNGKEIGRIIGFQPADKFIEEAGKYAK
jgi:thiol:disulfide interchange protein